MVSRISSMLANQTQWRKHNLFFALFAMIFYCFSIIIHMLHHMVSIFACFGQNFGLYLRIPKINQEKGKIRGCTKARIYGAEWK